LVFVKRHEGGSIASIDHEAAVDDADVVLVHEWTDLPLAGLSG
jgi:hypothetical protein